MVKDVSRRCPSLAKAAPAQAGHLSYI